MPSVSYMREIGAHVKCDRLHLAAISDADNGTPQDGASIDTEAQPGYEGYESAAFCVDVAGTLTASATLDLDVNLQDSDDGIAWANVAAGVLMSAENGGPGDLTAYALTQMVGGVNDDLAVKFNVETGRLRRFVRLQVTPTFSTTDSALVSVQAVSGGARDLPAGS
jgi:hypothetical protein